MRRDCTSKGKGGRRSAGARSGLRKARVGCGSDLRQRLCYPLCASFCNYVIEAPIEQRARAGQQQQRTETQPAKRATSREKCSFSFSLSLSPSFLPRIAYLQKALDVRPEAEEMLCGRSCRHLASFAWHVRTQHTETASRSQPWPTACLALSLFSFLLPVASALALLSGRG